ncbi:aspartate/glutamate racemase family protein [Actinomyces sp. zg-332]|uniref:aspartate/glutamate racemase family protein n=1 Tax=Actinomyces sp. zg-332 TaxID=2708340 RepID=UPI001423C93A|nr:aspartate/glutamate racemase family protein [Actinomyces sp. zg-332]QPK94670.1 aspartate/glutamate racemase family protein [Actinomyces sp. zg-332]
MRKIAVMAGTIQDTNMGRKVLEEKGYICHGEIPVSNTPLEQMIFQTKSSEYKKEIISKHIRSLEDEGFTHLFVYCNSLSGAVDFDELAGETGIKIVTPLHAYKEVAVSADKIMVISANAQGLAGIEKVLFSANENLQLIGITLLEMVKAIENNFPPEKILEDFKLESLLQYGEYFGIEKIILGCTHFPYLENQLTTKTRIEVVNPANKMISLLNI